MSLQKNRTKSQKNKEPNLLPVISHRPNKQQEPKKEWTSTAEIYQKYMRAKLENVLVEQKKQVINNNQKLKQVATPIINLEVQKNEQSPFPIKTLQKEALIESRHAKSTPKLSLTNLQKKKSLRENRERYLHNQKIAIQLNLPKRLDLSVDSEQQSLHRELLRDEEHILAQPTVFVLKKNTQHNLIRSSVAEQNVLITERPSSSSKLQIIDNSKYYPFVQNLPNKQQPLYAGPKESKYIRQKFVGQEAINKFYDRYKKIDKIREMQKFKLQLNPITMILTILQNYNIPPKKMEVIKLKGEEAILDLKNCALGGGVSLKAVSQIVQKVTVFQQIDLSYNQLTSDICDMIIPNLAKMRRINLSYNKVGRRGIDLLSTLFYNQEAQDDCELQQLDLQSNNLTDTCFSVFFTNLQNMNYLLVLNLSKNYLGNFAAVRIKEYLINDNQLCQLYLHWCEMGTKATKLIFQGLSKNNSIKVLDLSWNQIGFDGTKSFCTMVKSNTSLIHLDISFCQIDESDSRVIAKALKQNHTIYGLHYQGNMGFVDFKGFLHFIKKEQRQTPISIRAGLIQRINSTNIIKSLHHHHSNSQMRSACWICEGWDEKYFRIAKSQGDKGCFIHLNFENYTGVRMSDKGTYFQILRMCPPAKLQLFFTKINDNGNISHLHNPCETGEVKIVPFNKQIHQFTIEQKKIGPITLKYLNTVNQPLYYNQIFNEDYLTKIHCQPRSDDMRVQNIFPVTLPQFKQVQKTRKHKPKNKKGPKLAKEIEIKSIPEEFQNIFNKNKGIGDGQTYENFIKKCVQFDLSHSKVTKIIKQQKQLKEIKSILQKNYEIFQKIYYYLASNNPNNSGIYSISENRFEKFIQQQGYETKRVTNAKIRLKLISCLSNVTKDSEIIGFYRPQFFQFLLRLAIQKWCVAIPKKEGETEQQRVKRERYPLSSSEAFQRMIKSLKKYEQKAQSSKWREQNLTSYEISIVVKSYTSFLQQIYQKYAGLTQKNMNTKQKKKMLLQQMKMLFMHAQIKKTKQALKDLQIAYRTAKKLELQDGISDTGLDYVQFLQAFCRFAEGLYLTPIGSETNSLWQKQVIKSQQIPLFLKIEKLLKQVFNKNYDIKNKKMELLFETGLFPQQVGVLMHYYKQKYQNKDNLQKISLTTNIKMNGLSFIKNQKITLKYLITILEVKAAQVRQKNRQKLLEVASENKSSDEEQDQNK